MTNEYSDPNADPEDVARFNAMMAMGGSSIDLVIEREITAQDRDGLEAGPSAEAMTNLNNEMITWVGTRIMRYYGTTGLMPQVVTVTLDVKMNA